MVEHWVRLEHDIEGTHTLHNLTSEAESITIFIKEIYFRLLYTNVTGLVEQINLLIQVFQTRGLRDEVLVHLLIRLMRAFIWIFYPKSCQKNFRIEVQVGGP